MNYQIAETQEEKMLCYQLRAHEYGRRYRNIPKDLYQDEFDQAYLLNSQPQAYTVFVSEEDEIVGTIRLALAYDMRFPDLSSEAAQLMKLEGGLATHLVQTIRPTVPLLIGELGKLAVSRDIGIRSKDVLATLLHGSANIAQSLGINVLIGVMAPFVVRAINTIGGTFHLDANAHLDRDTYEQLAYLVKYHEYFLPQLAANHREVEMVNFVEGKTWDELVKISSSYPDGPQLYWNWTEAFLQSLTLMKVET